MAGGWGVGTCSVFCVCDILGIINAEALEILPLFFNFDSNLSEFVSCQRIESN